MSIYSSNEIVQTICLFLIIFSLWCNNLQHCYTCNPLLSKQTLLLQGFHVNSSFSFAISPRYCVNDEVIKLAETYINDGALTNKSYNDALPIALATTNNADVLASWNFKHIVNINRIRLYNSINLKLGYKMLEIRTPREILNTTNDGTE